MEESHRAFIALPLPQALIAEITRVQQALALSFPELRWSRPETLHLTLRFLGNLTEESLDCVAKTVLSVGLSTAAFSVKISDLGAFPGGQHPRVFILALAPCPALTDLHRRLEAQLETLGLPPDPRPFRPHLTLGRVHKRLLSSPPPEGSSLAEKRWEAREMVLYTSRLTAHGPFHTPVARGIFHD